MKPAWFVGAAAVVGFGVWRRRKLEPTLLIGGALVAAAMVVYGTGVVRFPNLDTILTHVGRTLGAWTYLLVGVSAYLETGAFIGLLAPGETVILIGGVVAGQGKINLAALIAIIWIAAVAGDLTSFALGRRLGRAFLVRHGSKVHITEERIRQVEGFYERHGGQTVILGRFVGLVRAVSPFLAGSSDMPMSRFVAYDVVGAGLWGSAFCLLGFVFWRSLDKVLAAAKQGSLILAVVIVAVVVIIAAVRWLREDDNRTKLTRWWDRQSQRPALRPVVAVVRPVVRWSRGPAVFLGERFTPGGLGLELTTLVALASVGAFVFFSYAATVAHGFVTVGDHRTYRWASHFQTAWLTDTAKVVTDFGTLYSAGAALVIVAVLLAAKRHWLESSVLVVGFALSQVAWRVAKAIVDRARPPRGLVAAAGSSFPSGHAATSVAWLAIAVAIWRVMPGAKLRATVIAIGIVMTAAVGISRIYLHVHWFSDVAAGWGLALLVYGACGIVALTINYRRGRVGA